MRSAFALQRVDRGGGMLIAAWIWPFCSAATIASSLEKYWSPKPSITGLGP